MRIAPAVQPVRIIHTHILTMYSYTTRLIAHLKSDLLADVHPQWLQIYSSLRQTLCAHHPSILIFSIIAPRANPHLFSLKKKYKKSFSPCHFASGYRLACLKRNREGRMADGSGERGRTGGVKKRQLYFQHLPLSLLPSLQDAECESRRRREAGGGQGEQQYGGKASRQARMKGRKNRFK